jgi:antitoxin (DNA-binding transcriptional repressor) of toxin-antitoxin stability system
MTQQDQTQTPPPPKQVGVREFRANVRDYLRQASQGSSFLVTSHGQVLAEVRPPPVSGPPASVAKVPGEQDPADTAVDHPPPDVIAAMEGGTQ